MTLFALKPNLLKYLTNEWKDVFQPLPGQCSTSRLGFFRNSFTTAFDASIMMNLQDMTLNTVKHSLRKIKYLTG